LAPDLGMKFLTGVQSFVLGYEVLYPGMNVCTYLGVKFCTWLYLCMNFSPECEVLFLILKFWTWAWIYFDYINKLRMKLSYPGATTLRLWQPLRLSWQFSWAIFGERRLAFFSKTNLMIITLIPVCLINWTFILVWLHTL
jgi:hypothetical protein